LPTSLQENLSQLQVKLSVNPYSHI